MVLLAHNRLVSLAQNLTQLRAQKLSLERFEIQTLFGVFCDVRTEG